MKNIIYHIFVIILIILITIVALMMLDNRIRSYDRSTAKMGIEWKNNTCYLYWE